MAAKITPVVPTPRRYEARRAPPLILSGVSQETDVTDVIDDLVAEISVAVFGRV
jgi:hypothetical protein